jgi:hypothetical protein
MPCLRHFLFFLFLFLTQLLQPITSIDHFEGAQPRPLLSINKPENGQVLESGDVNVEISILGYDFPSIFHDSSICVALTTGIISSSYAGYS